MLGEEGCSCDNTLRDKILLSNHSPKFRYISMHCALIHFCFCFGGKSYYESRVSARICPFRSAASRTKGETSLTGKFRTHSTTDAHIIVLCLYLVRVNELLVLISCSRWALLDTVHCFRVLIGCAREQSTSELYLLSLLSNTTQHNTSSFM